MTYFQNFDTDNRINLDWREREKPSKLGVNPSVKEPRSLSQTRAKQFLLTQQISDISDFHGKLRFDKHQTNELASYCC